MNRLQSSDPFLHRSVAGLLKPVGDIGEAAGMRIGRARPVSLRIETFGTETRPRERIENAVAKVFDLRPASIIETLDLKRPIFAATSTYGHFGRDLPDFTWERTDRVEELLRAL